jgi:2-isopropylmalate synthase
MKFEHGLDLPRRLQIEFSSVIQQIVERTGTEITATEIASTFAATYLDAGRELVLAGEPVVRVDDDGQIIDVHVEAGGRLRQLHGRGGDTVAAFTDALARECGIAVQVLDRHDQTMGDGPDATAVVYVETRLGSHGGPGRIRWGVGRDRNPVMAALRALVSAVNRG